MREREVRQYTAHCPERWSASLHRTWGR